MLIKFAKFACIASLLACLYTTPIHAQNGHEKAMWVWDYYQSLSTDEQRQELIQFSLNNNINLLFVGTKTTLKDHPEEYAEFIQKAHKNGIRVFALAGNASWAQKENHQYALEQLKQVLDFNASHPSDEFDGLQFDIEPYSLPAFKKNAAVVSTQLLDLFEASVKMIPIESKEGFELNAAVPFWYASGQQSIIIEYNEARKPLSHHILDLFDSVTIMAYRDNAAAQIELSKADVEYASSAGKKAYIGAETMPSNGSSILETITYNNKKTSYLTKQLEEISQHYVNHPGFAGVAVHSYDSFKAMLQREEEQLKLLEKNFSVLKAAGIFNGYSDGSARFGRKATRAEIAAIAARLGGYADENLYKPDSAHFRDVPPEAWYYGWIESAYQMGVMNGKDGQKFIPDANITLEETLIVMAKVIGLSEVKGAEVQGASVWAQGWVRAMIDAGLIEQREHYQNEISRDDLINIVYETFLLP